MRREAANELPTSTLQEKKHPPLISAQENTSSGHAPKQQNNNNYRYTAKATQIDVINQWGWQLLCWGWMQSKQILGAGWERAAAHA